MNFDDAFGELLIWEGGYSNNPKDPGGETNYGITRNTARKYGYLGAMKDIQLPTVKYIYRKAYWEPLRCDQLPDEIRYAVFDAGVNSGIDRSVKWLQIACNAPVDGIIGPVTIAAANTMDPIALLSRLVYQRLNYLTSLPIWPAFSRGWTQRVLSILYHSI